MRETFTVAVPVLFLLGMSTQHWYQNFFHDYLEAPLLILMLIWLVVVCWCDGSAPLPEEYPVY